MVYIGVGGDNKNSTYTIRAHLSVLSDSALTDDVISITGGNNEDVSESIDRPVLLQLLDGLPQVWFIYEVLLLIYLE